MATSVLTALRHDARLKGNLKFTALEVGHLMNSAGYGRVAYQMMAYKTGYSRRTMITHMHRLVALGIFRKTVYRLKFGNAINLYTLRLPIPRLACPMVRNGKGESASLTLPTHKTEEKTLSLVEEIQRLKKGLRFTTEGSLPWTTTMEKIAALEALQQGDPSTTQ